MEKLFNKVCDICGEQKEWRDPGVRKNGEPYDGFYSCPNWRDASHKSKPKRNNGERVNMSAIDSIKILADEMEDFRKHFDERFDGLAKFLNDKFK